MKLRDIYNEIKMVPPNRILLIQPDFWTTFFQQNYYIFKIDGRVHMVNKNQLKNGKIKWRHPDKQLLFFLDKKHIPYQIENDIISIESKYFITP